MIDLGRSQMAVGALEGALGARRSPEMFQAREPDAPTDIGGLPTGTPDAFAIRGRLRRLLRVRALGRRCDT